MRSRERNTVLALMLTIAVLAFALPGCAGVPVTTAAESYKVSLDLNPSVELTVTGGTVTAVEAFNDDGSVIVLGTDVSGMSLSDAVTAIVTEMIAGGYIAKTEIAPYLLITVSNDSEANPALSDALEQAAEAVIEGSEIPCKVKSTYVSGEVEAASDALGLSIGRYMLFKWIADEEGITVEDAVDSYGHLSIGEIMEMFKDAKFAFRYRDSSKDESVSGSEDESGFLGTLTPEQLAVVEPLFAQLKADLAAARDTFHSTYKAIRDAYKTGLESLRAPGKKDHEAIQSQRTALRDTMLADRRAAITARADAVAAARETFVLGLTTAGIPQELLGNYFNWLDKEEKSIENDEPEESESAESEPAESEIEESGSEGSEIEESQPEESEIEESQPEESEIEESEPEESEIEESEPEEMGESAALGGDEYNAGNHGKH